MGLNKKDNHSPKIVQNKDEGTDCSRAVLQWRKRPDDQLSRKTLFAIINWLFLKHQYLVFFLSLFLCICYNPTHSQSSLPLPILYLPAQNRVRDIFRSAIYCSLLHCQQYSCCPWLYSRITHSPQAWSGIMLLLAGTSVIGDMAVNFTKEFRQKSVPKF